MSAADIAWCNRVEPIRPPRAMQACEGCRHFTPDRINPPAGMGLCSGLRAGEGMWPGQGDHCRGWAARSV